MIKRSAALFLVLIPCVYFFITYNSNTEQVHTTSSLKLETGNSQDKLSIAYAEEITEQETLKEDFKYQESENTVRVDVVNISNSEHVSEKQSKNNRGRGFYTSVNGGKVYSNNSKVFVDGIRAILKKTIDFVNSYDNSMVKSIMTNVFGIKEFNGKFDVNFQWVGGASLGYYAAENGRVDFEIMYSKVNIIEDNNTTPIFDQSAGIFAFLLNFYYNPSIQDTRFAPYIGFGIGPTVFRLKQVNTSPQDLIPSNALWFAYQVKLGVDYTIIPGVKAFVGYRYFNIPVPVVDAIATHSIEGGLLFNF